MLLARSEQLRQMYEYGYPLSTTAIIITFDPICICFSISEIEYQSKLSRIHENSCSKV